MNSKASSLAASATLFCLSIASVWAADSAAPIEAIWKPQQIVFPYQGFTTAYDCDALADKVERILRAVGAHQEVTARASGCIINKPSRSITVRLTAATPVEASQMNKLALAQDPERAKLIERIGGKQAIDADAFAAVWQTVALNRDRPLDLEPGDCELLEQLRDRVLPKLQVKIIENEVHCTPHQLSSVTPRLVVSALIKAPDPSQPSVK